jgi:fatty acid/phospholipid biosynthesis enzyme
MCSPRRLKARPHRPASALINEHLAERGVRATTRHRGRSTHAPDVIGMDESPTRAVRQRTESSIVKMAMLGSHKAENPSTS